ncbi:MAG: hypothetical protein ABIH41_02885 [Nanoarchaeota archaeon]
MALFHHDQKHANQEQRIKLMKQTLLINAKRLKDFQHRFNLLFANLKAVYEFPPDQLDMLKQNYFSFFSHTIKEMQSNQRNLLKLLSIELHQEDELKQLADQIEQHVEILEKKFGKIHEEEKDFVPEIDHIYAEIEKLEKEM